MKGGIGAGDKMQFSGLLEQSAQVEQSLPHAAALQVYGSESWSLQAVGSRPTRSSPHFQQH